jgi:hypothetical protein
MKSILIDGIFVCLYKKLKDPIKKILSCGKKKTINSPVILNLKTL